ncbi:MAG: DUF5990 family protein [Pyrinomonadaceae bacterium]
MKHQLPIRIKVLRPPAGVSMMVQRGANELLAPVSSVSDELIFDFEISVDISESHPNFLGKYAQGPNKDRFIYVNSGTLAGQFGSVWTRRAKLSLMSITLEQIEQAINEQMCLATKYEGTGRDAGPTCASVKGLEWRVEKTREINPTTY